ncbi:MAG: alpha/beta fold hydrolase [Ignavibacteria bacterium]|nr:alpha/beta fold hydrolase [Ignavibacteria bacterium]
MGSTLLMLHGALGSSVQLEPLAELMSSEFNVVLFNFSGHGDKPFPETSFSIKTFAEEIRELIEKSRTGPCRIFGYSMGGYAALYAARHFPGVAGKIFTLGTKFDWNIESSARETAMLDPARIISKVPSFAKTLEERHYPNDWKDVLRRTSEMMLSLGNSPELTPDDLSAIENEVTVGVGDRDNMVSITESESAFRKLRHGRLLVMPDTHHPIEKVRLSRLKSELMEFFGE